MKPKCSELWLDVGGGVRTPWRKELHRDFERALAATKLPERPDYEAANRFLIKARWEAASIWQGRGVRNSRVDGSECSGSESPHTLSPR